MSSRTATVSNQTLPAGHKPMSTPNEKDLIVQEILEEMSLKEKAEIASLDEKDILHFHDLFDACISSHYGEDDEMGKEVIHRVWEVLQATHRIRRVK
jgi:hypothetical protein